MVWSGVELIGIQCGRSVSQSWPRVPKLVVRRIRERHALRQVACDQR